MRRSPGSCQPLTVSSRIESRRSGRGTWALLRIESSGTCGGPPPRDRAGPSARPGRSSEETAGRQERQGQTEGRMDRTTRRTPRRRTGTLSGPAPDDTSDAAGPLILSRKPPETRKSQQSKHRTVKVHPSPGPEVGPRERASTLSKCRERPSKGRGRLVELRGGRSTYRERRSKFRRRREIRRGSPSVRRRRLCEYRETLSVKRERSSEFAERPSKRLSLDFAHDVVTCGTA